MAIDIDKVVTFASANAEDSSQSLCAKYVRLALQAGGADLSHHPGQAKDYGPTLLGLGFADFYYWDGTVGYPVALNRSCRIVNQCYAYDPVKGDVIVIQPYPDGNPAGHIAIWTGEKWVSDFVQRDMWAGPGYRSARPSFTIYRL